MLFRSLEHEFLHHLRNDLGREMGEGDDRVEPIPELRREQAVDRLLVVAFAIVSVTFAVVGPKILGEAINLIVAGSISGSRKAAARSPA